MSKKWEETDAEDEFRVLRSPFYTCRSGSYFGSAHIVIGSKPEDIDLRTVEIDVLTNFYKERKDKESWSVRKLPFKIPIRKS